MAAIVLLGINHDTAPVSLRECIAFSKEESALAVQTLHRTSCIDEVLLFSTCNRVEVLLTTENITQAVAETKKFIAGFNKIQIEKFEDFFYLYEADEAIRHVFRVAASLDSLVVGEPQILGQIKEAYRTATDMDTSGVILNRLLHRAFFVAKRVRSETGIGDRAVSISYAAVELGKKIFGNLENKKVLLIGAGEMAEIAVEHLIRNRADEILVANRTFESGVELADAFGGKAIRFEEIAESLKQVDIIISSTGSPDFVLDRQQVKAVIRKRRNRPLFFIDIAVPRDIDPEINRLANCYVYDIDDLKDIIDENIEDRKKEAVKAERIVDEAVIKFRQWYNALDIVPTIVALRTKLEDIAELEVNKTMRSSTLSDEDSAKIQKMINSIIKKILHDPTNYLKTDSQNKTADADMVRNLFKLDD
jgi:glutamyl-tRNA reductase